MFEYDPQYVPEEKLYEIDCLELIHPENLPFHRVIELHNKLDRFDLWIHRRLHDVINKKIQYVTELLENLKELITFEKNKKSVQIFKKDIKRFEQELYDFMRLQDIFYTIETNRFYS